MAGLKCALQMTALFPGLQLGSPDLFVTKFNHLSLCSLVFGKLKNLNDETFLSSLALHQQQQHTLPISPNLFCKVKNKITKFKFSHFFYIASDFPLSIRPMESYTAQYICSDSIVSRTTKYDLTLAGPPPKLLGATQGYTK